MSDLTTFLTEAVSLGEVRGAVCVLVAWLAWVIVWRLSPGRASKARLPDEPQPLRWWGVRGEPGHDGNFKPTSASVTLKPGANADGVVTVRFGEQTPQSRADEFVHQLEKFRNANAIVVDSGPSVEFVTGPTDAVKALEAERHLRDCADKGLAAWRDRADEANAALEAERAAHAETKRALESERKDTLTMLDTLQIERGTLDLSKQFIDGWKVHAIAFGYDARFTDEQNAERAKVARSALSAFDGTAPCPSVDDAPAQPATPKRTVKVRAAVTVTERGEWSVDGCSDWDDDQCLSVALDAGRHGQHVAWLVADVPLPDVPTVQATVTPAGKESEAPK